MVMSTEENGKAASAVTNMLESGLGMEWWCGMGAENDGG